MKEIWKDIEGYDGDYQVSNLGRVKSFKGIKERILKPAITGMGYLCISLCKNSKGKTYNVHRIVGLAHVPNPDNKPEINHIDGNKINNNANNLEWTTSSENTQHAIKNCLQDSRGEKCGNSKLTDKEILEIRKKYKTGKYLQRELSDFYNVTQSLISFIINRKNWKHI